ncbi:MAG TPA: Rne/Rng family ribonuclease [Phycisphaerae bacterium]|nr:Rne/Rng family ribonuclease [Phycisphaerae bacterium]
MKNLKKRSRSKKPKVATGRSTRGEGAQPDPLELSEAIATAKIVRPSAKRPIVSSIGNEVDFSAGILEADERPSSGGAAFIGAASSEAPHDMLPTALARWPSDSAESLDSDSEAHGVEADGDRPREATAREAAAFEQRADAAELRDQAERRGPPDGEKGAEERPSGRRRSRRRGGRGRGRGRATEGEAGGEASPAISESSSEQPVVAREIAAPTQGISVEGETTLVDEDLEEVEEAPRRGRRRAKPEAADAEETPPAAAERREMLINVSDPDEVRIALLRAGRLDELYIERTTSVSNVGNIYKGRITNVEPSIQAAFVDFGKPAHGFLHISDLHPRYFPESKGEPELVGRKTPRRHRPPIQNCLRRGQEVIVQVIKEGVGTKGPTLSSYISLPGRFLVMMPGMDELGVSRKIEDEEQRRDLREILGQLSLPKDMGFIARTAAIDRQKRDLQRDLNYLARLWENVEERIKNEPAPAELYKESDLVIRTIRDVFDSSLHKIIVDNAPVASRVKEFLAIASPRGQDVVTLYEDPEPIFHRYGIESEIDKLHSKHVALPCGGSLVIESTEALVAIDVNSGRFRVHDNPEETAYRVNLEAADEIARQLRLRDLGGLIICDFIDMMQEKHRRSIEYRLADALEKHKERAKVLKISRFGILEMTRQRQRPSFAKSMFQDCPRCNGSGRIKATESVGLDVMREIRMAGQREGVASIDVRVTTSVANDLLNRKRHQITDLERATGQSIRIQGDPLLGMDEVHISCIDRRGREVPLGAARPVTPVGGGGPREVGRPAGGGGSTTGRRGGRRRGRGRGRGGSR